jgi:REP element-mobilizing transposase RayT
LEPKTWNMSPTIRSRGYLPHWECDHAVYFVTFRLADSLPQELLARLRQERAALDRSRSTVSCSAGFQPASVSKTPAGKMPALQADQTRARKLQAILQKAEQCLDGGLGECHMRDPRIAKIVADTIRHFDGQRYQLIAWCVMPNHVHVIFSPLGEETLETILHAWKSYSAHEANTLLRRTGHFWQREYFDHIVRNETSLHKIIRYVEDNPQKAGLQNWPWVSSAVSRSAVSHSAVSGSAGFQPAPHPERRQDGSATK